MNIDDVADAIEILVPGAQYGLSIIDDDIVLDWQDSRKKPTTDQITAKLTDAQQARAWQALRTKRDALLAASDWTQVADAPVNPSAWSTYRQALRDLPANTTDPTAVVWPTPPS